MANANSVRSVYQTVVDDVINGVREAFLDEGMDEQALNELKQLWESKLMMSKAVDSLNAPAEPEVSHFAGYPHQSQKIHTQQLQPQFVQKQQALQQQQLVQQQQQLQQQHVQQQQQFIQQQIIPTAHKRGPTLTQTSGPPPAHQHHIQHLGNFQGQSQIQFVGTQMSAAAQMGLAGAAYHQPVLVGTAYSNGQLLVPGGSQSTQPDSKPNSTVIYQIDGLGDSSSEEEEEDEEEDEEQNDEAEEAAGEEEDPLNSGDDISDADPTEVFDAENVVVCQFDKINRSKNKWKFHLKDGIMNLNGKDYVFQKATGDAEW